MNMYQYYFRYSFDVPYIKVRSMCPVDFLMVSLSVLTGQTMSYSPFPRMANRSNCRHLGGAFLLGSWLFGALIIGSAYKSMILALLVRVDYEEPLSTTQVI